MDLTITIDFILENLIKREGGYTYSTSRPTDHASNTPPADTQATYVVQTHRHARTFSTEQSRGTC